MVVSTRQERPRSPDLQLDTDCGPPPLKLHVRKVGEGEDENVDIDEEEEKEPLESLLMPGLLLPYKHCSR